MLHPLALKLATLAGVAIGWAFTDRSERQRLSGTVNIFVAGCERLLTALERGDLLTDEETRAIEFYCKEVLQKVNQQQTIPAPKQEHNLDP
jgi:hypothetical protein